MRALSWTVRRSTCVPFIVCGYICIYKYVFLLLTPIQENGVKEEGEGQGEGAPDSFPQGPPDAVSPTPGLREDDDDPLLEEGEVDMRAMMVAGGVMEFELLRLPPQSKTVGAWTFQQGGRGKVVCILASRLFTHVRMHTMLCVWDWTCYIRNVCNSLCSPILPPPLPLPSSTH